MRRGAAEAGAALVLVALAVVLYRQALGLWWTFDDFFHLRLVLDRPALAYLVDPAAARSGPRNVFTPLLLLSLAADRGLAGLEPHGFYLHQLLALGATAAVLYGLLRLWLPRGWSFAGALVFLLGPPAVAAAPLLMVRHYLEALLLAGLAAWSYVSAVRRRRAALAALSGLLYLLAALAKEIAVPLALVLPLLPAGPARRRLAYAVPHVLALGVYAGLRAWLLRPVVAGYGWAVVPAEWPRLVVALPLKVARQFAGQGGAAGAVLAILVVATAGVAVARRRALPLALAAALAALLPVLPVSSEMQPRFALAAWAVAAAAFAAGGGRLAAAGGRARAAGAVLLAAVLLAAATANRVAWRPLLAEQERRSAENRLFLDLEAGEMLRQPLGPAASLTELRWLKETHLGRPAGAGWFQDDLYLCGRRPPPRRVWGWDAERSGLRELAPAALRRRHCRAVRWRAPLSGRFAWSAAGLFWELGPYEAGRYALVMEDGVTVVPVPRRAGYRVPQAALELRIRYVAPAGWTTYSAPIALERGGPERRWRRPAAAGRSPGPPAASGLDEDEEALGRQAVEVGLREGGGEALGPRRRRGALGHQREAVEPGAPQPVVEGAGGEEPVVGVAEDADRQVVPAPGDQVLDDGVVADVGHRQDGAPARRQELGQPGEETLRFDEVLEELEGEHQVVTAGDRQRLDVAGEHAVEPPAGRPRHHRVELHPGDAAAQPLPQEGAGLAAPAADLEHLARSGRHERQHVDAGLAVVIDELVMDAGGGDGPGSG